MEAKKETTADKIASLNEKISRLHRTSTELPKLRKQLEELEETRDAERLVEIEEEMKGVARHGPEAAALKMEREEIEQRIEKRKEALEEIKNNELKQKNNKAKTNIARERSSTSGKVDKEKEKPSSRKSSNNVRME